MNDFRWIAVGALWVAAAVVLGAFGAHALHERLVAADALDHWRTAVQYHGLHGLACIAFGLYRRTRPADGKNWIGWLFLVGSLAFSGSLYGLCLGGPGAVLGPVTPLGGLLLIAGWVALAVDAARAGGHGPDGAPRAGPRD